MSIPFWTLLTAGVLPSPVKRMVYRWKGARIGKNVKFGLCSWISARSLEIGDDTKIGAFSFLSVRKLKLGKRVHIRSFVIMETKEVILEDDVIVMEQVFVGGTTTPRSQLVIGKRVKLFPMSFINPTEPIYIGDDASVGGANALFTHGSWQSMLDGFPVAFGPIRVEKGAWLPWRVTILPNVTVGEYATIGAASVLTKDIPSRCLAVGSPAKVIRKGTEYIRKLSESQRHRMVLDILREFAEYLRYLGYRSKLHEEVDAATLQLSRRGTTWTVFYSRCMKSPLPRAHVFISLARIDESLRTELIRKKTLWFGLEDKQCTHRPDPIWREVRSFFSRYGVRFDVLDT